MIRGDPGPSQGRPALDRPLFRRGVMDINDASSVSNGRLVEIGRAHV